MKNSLFKKLCAAIVTTTLLTSLAFIAAPTRTYAQQEEPIATNEQAAANVITLEAGSPSIGLSGPVLAKVGEQFQVSVSLSTYASGVKAGKFTVDYNSALFDYVSASAATAKTQIINENKGISQVTIVTANPGDALVDGEKVLLLTFTAKVRAGVNNIQVSAELGVDAEGAMIKAPASTHGIAVSAEETGVKGDLNGNNVVDIGDLAVLITYFGINNSSPDWSKVAASDFDGNGVIEISDLAALGKIIVFDAGKSFDVMETSVMDIQNAMEAGTLSAVELVKMYLARIAAYDSAGPALKSIISINPDALTIAKQLDDERKKTGARSLLHGVPIIVKDNYNTIGMATSAGCTCLKNNFTTSDAFMVEKLKDAGAIILAKSNLHEFAFGLSTISSLGGQTLNPYDLTKNPGGSSGGTGAALAANFGVIGLGTDTGGSIRVPSSYNNLVGLRPTIGLTSREGIIPLALSQDVGGPIARSVEDIAISMDILKGYDPDDAATLYSVGRTPTTYTKYLDADGLKGARIGVIDALLGTNAKVKGLTEQAIADMEAAGATIVHVEVPNLTKILNYSSLSGYEFKSQLDEYFEKYINNVPGTLVPYRSLGDIIASNTDMLTDQLASYKTRNAIGDLSTNTAYIDIILNRPKLSQQSLLKVMTDNDLDALLYPSTANPPSSLSGTSAGSANRLSPFSGFPAISVPAGFVDNGMLPKLPQNIELLGRPFDEQTLIKLAYSYEQHTHHREAPSTTPALVEAPQEQPALLEPAA
ncbi:amidase family protein [Paenibacillus sp. FJAT-27812]|uniref:amidase family protein n=1 Tax=Paenibacillus sp. FJAT-27812 TaxID=1684143 RepID=UPI0009ECBC84|nr:amidase family protein [Paenibacillus sp. FJAT-27812]